MKIIPSNLFLEEYDGLELQFHYISPQPNESLGWARNNGLTHKLFTIQECKGFLQSSNYLQRISHKIEYKTNSIAKAISKVVYAQKYYIKEEEKKIKS